MREQAEGWLIESKSWTVGTAPDGDPYWSPPLEQVGEVVSYNVGPTMFDVATGIAGLITAIFSLWSLWVLMDSLRRPKREDDSRKHERWRTPESRVYKGKDMMRNNEEKYDSDVVAPRCKPPMPEPNTFEATLNADKEAGEVIHASEIEFVPTVADQKACRDAAEKATKNISASRLDYLKKWSTAYEAKMESIKDFKCFRESSQREDKNAKWTRPRYGVTKDGHEWQEVGKDYIIRTQGAFLNEEPTPKENRLARQYATHRAQHFDASKTPNYHSRTWLSAYEEGLKLARKGELR